MEKQIKSSGFSYNETEISSYYQRSEKKNFCHEPGFSLAWHSRWKFYSFSTAHSSLLSHNVMKLSIFSIISTFSWGFQWNYSIFFSKYTCIPINIEKNILQEYNYLSHPLFHQFHSTKFFKTNLDNGTLKVDLGGLKLLSSIKFRHKKLNPRNFSRIMLIFQVVLNFLAINSTLYPSFENVWTHYCIRSDSTGSELLVFRHAIEYMTTL